MSKRKYTPEEWDAYNKGKAARAYRKGAAPLGSKGNEYYKYKYKSAQAKRKATKEPGVVSHIGEALGGIGATALLPEGGPISSAVGSFLGGKIGHLIEKITGFGDYKIQSNSIMRGGMTAPQIINTTNKGGVVVRFREYLQDVPATIVFTNNVFYLNPGQQKTFPWLSTFAKNWQQYRWRGLIFEFGSTSSDAVLSSATSSALGTISMATDYDVLDTNYTNKREMLNTVFANSSKPSCSFIHPIECKRSQTPISVQYVRTGDYPEGGDPRMYDLGKFQIATEGMQAATGSIGELWVTYEVEFFKQQLGSAAYTDMFAFSTVTAPFWLGTLQPTKLAGSTIGGTIGSDGTNSYYELPSYIAGGKYLFTYWVSGVSATIGICSPSVSNGSLVDLWNAGASLLQFPAAGTSASGLMVQFVVEVSSSLCRVTFGTANVPTVANNGNLLVTLIAPNLQDN